MRKIVFLLCLCFVSLWAEDFNASIEERIEAAKSRGIYPLSQKYISLVKELDALNVKSDNNASIFAKEKESIKMQEKEILAKFPSAISSLDIDPVLAELFIEHRKKVEQELLKAQKKQDFNLVKIRYQYANIELDGNFYRNLFELQNLFKEAASRSQIVTSVQKGLDNIEQSVNIRSELSGVLEKLSELELKQSEELQANLQDKAKAYNEILKYILDNASLLESNLIFSELKIQVFIDEINKIVPNSSYFNSGKVAIILLICLVFYILKIILPKIFFFFLVKFLYKKSDELSKDEIKNVFIENSRKPFSVLLFVYSLSICASVVYYPAPVVIGLTSSFYIIYAILIAWLVMSMLDSYGVILVSKIAQKSGKKEIANLIIKILYFVIIIITTLFILALLGFNINAIIASLGIGGLAVALAAKDMIANFFASIIVSFDDSINQGDWIAVSGTEGTVVEVGLRKTTIRTFDNALVYLPNSTIMGANIVNWSKRRVGRQLKMKLGVTYDATPEQLEQCVKDLKEYLLTSELVAQTNDSALTYGDYRARYRQNLVSINDLEGYKNACYVSLCEFGDSSINIELYFYVKGVSSREFRAARQTLMLDFMRIIAKNGLSFAFPSMSVYIEKQAQNNEKAKE